MEIILGSQSPRRKEILSYFSLPFNQMTSDFNEHSVFFKGDPIAYVTEIAMGKAQALMHRFPESLILTADTIVFFNGKVYGKPKDEEEAFQALSELSGNWHVVYTAVTLQQYNKVVHDVETTRVLFNALTPEQIRHYLAHVDWADKAGGYAIQMRGGLMVSKIDGCYYNVMGLPINTLEKLLKHFGIELWDYF